MTRRTTVPAQKALFGRQEPVATSGKSAAATNDPELMADVVRVATDPGYVVVGPAERVFRRVDGTKQKGAPVEPVPAYEQDVVRQLLGSGHLRTGGAHTVRHAGREASGSSVLVPRATRDMVTRWSNLVPLHGRSRSNGGPGDGRSTPAARLWCPECGEPATARPPTRWTAANGPRPEHSHRDGEPLCPVMTAQGYQPAKPTTQRPA
jgi:hypothetical protein